MTDCLGCNAVSGPANALHCGRMVCATCPEWLIECEAREILRMDYRQGADAANARLRELGAHHVARHRIEDLAGRVAAIRAAVRADMRAKGLPNWLTRQQAVLA